MSICEPVEDLRGSVEYKIAMAGEMTRRALHTAAKRAGASAPPNYHHWRGNGKKDRLVSFNSMVTRSTWPSSARAVDSHAAREVRTYGPHIGCETTHCGACHRRYERHVGESCTV